MNGTPHDTNSGWEKFLDPDSLKTNLVRASVYLVSYELLKSIVIENPRGFFNMGCTVPGEYGSEYKDNILSLCPKDPFHASCMWFRNMNVVDDADITIIGEIRTHRNDIAHELLKYISDSRYAVNMQLLDSIHFLIGKIERWWIREVEMEVNSDYDHVDKSAIPDHHIHSGRMMLADWIHKVIHGQEGDLRQLLAFERLLRKKDDGDSNRPQESRD